MEGAQTFEPGDYVELEAEGGHQLVGEVLWSDANTIHLVSRLEVDKGKLVRAAKWRGMEGSVMRSIRPDEDTSWPRWQTALVVALAVVAWSSWSSRGGEIRELRSDVQTLREAAADHDGDSLRLETAVCLADAEGDVRFHQVWSLGVPPEMAVGFGCGFLTEERPDGRTPSSNVPLWPDNRLVPGS